MPDIMRRLRETLMVGDPVYSKDHRMVAFILCLCLGLASFKELASIKIDNVQTLPGGSLELFVEKVRTMAWGTAGRTVRWTSSKPTWTGHNLCIHRALFISCSPRGLPIEKPMSYSSTRQQLKSVLDKLDLGPKVRCHYGLHFPWVGATSAASKLRMSMEVIQQVDRWQSVNTLRVYVVAEPGEPSRTFCLLYLTGEVVHLDWTDIFRGDFIQMWTILFNLNMCYRILTKILYTHGIHDFKPLQGYLFA